MNKGTQSPLGRTQPGGETEKEGKWDELQKS